MGKIMLNGECFGKDIEANPTIPSGSTPTNLNSMRIDKDYFNIAGGGGGSLTIDTIYDSGSTTTPAAIQTNINYDNSALLSDYDFVIAEFSGDRGGQYSQSSFLVAPVDELLNNSEGWALYGFGERYLLIDMQDTYFNIILNSTYGLYKLFGVKF